MNSLGLAIWLLCGGPATACALDNHQESDRFLVATSLNNRGERLRRQGRYEEAAALLRKSLEEWEDLLGAAHAHLAVPLNNLALVDLAQGRLASAEKRLRRALEIRRAALGEAHPLVSFTMRNLSVVLAGAGRPTEAEKWSRLAALPAGEIAPR
ncbi:MAG: tetratricopeptide repeat protein [Bryobacteraceae bacterium]